MDTEYTLDQIEMYNKTYEWIIEQNIILQKEIKNLPYSELGSSKHVKLIQKYEELQKRFNSCKDSYNKIINDVKKYFEDNHNIDIMEMVEGLENDQ